MVRFVYWIILTELWKRIEGVRIGISVIRKEFYCNSPGKRLYSPGLGQI